MNVVVHRYLGRSRLAEELVEDVLIVEHQSAMFASDVDELVIECLELEKISKSTWNYVLGILFSDQHTNGIDGIDQVMKTATAKVLTVFERVGKLIKSAQASGHAIRDEADFWLACREIQSINDDVENKFPRIDEEMIKRSLQSYTAGKYRAAEDLLRDAQGQGS